MWMTSAPTCSATTGRPLCSQASRSGRCPSAIGPATIEAPGASRPYRSSSESWQATARSTPQSPPGRRSARQRSGRARPGQSARPSRRPVPEVPQPTCSLRRSHLAEAYASVGERHKHALVTGAPARSAGKAGRASGACAPPSGCVVSVLSSPVERPGRSLEAACPHTTARHLVRRISKPLLCTQGPNSRNQPFDPVLSRILEDRQPQDSTGREPGILGSIRRSRSPGCGCISELEKNRNRLRSSRTHACAHA